MPHEVNGTAPMRAEAGCPRVCFFALFLAMRVGTSLALPPPREGGEEQAEGFNPAMGRQAPEEPSQGRGYGYVGA